MDYSLLLGIQKGISEFIPLAETEAGSDDAADALVLPASHTNSANLYYVGIIDILQKWDREKRTERCCKALLGKDLDGVSSIEPEKYLERFVRKMDSHVYREPGAAQSTARGLFPEGSDAAVLGLMHMGSGSGRTRKVYFLQGVNTTDGTCTLNREPFDLKVVNNVETRHTFRDVRLTDDSATLDTGDLEEVQRKFELFLGEKMQCST